MGAFVASAIVVHLIIVALIWREHMRAYYRLEEMVEDRLGSVREFTDGVGFHPLSSSGLMPKLKKITEIIGDLLSDEELAVLKRSRAFYYTAGAWSILVFLAVLSALIFMAMTGR